MSLRDLRKIDPSAPKAIENQIKMVLGLTPNRTMLEIVEALDLSFLPPSPVAVGSIGHNPFNPNLIVIETLTSMVERRWLDRECHGGIEFYSISHGAFFAYEREHNQEKAA